MDIKNPITSTLFKAVSTLRTEDEYYSFFEDLCTVDELLEMSNRFRIAKLLYHGKKYTEIQKLTGCSMGTISRINRTFKYGNDGYKLVFERLKQSTPPERINIHLICIVLTELKAFFVKTQDAFNFLSYISLSW